MKTFKWTVPECPPSRVEREYSKRVAAGSYWQPSEQELREFRRWEKLREKGPARFIAHILAYGIIIYAGMVIFGYFIDPDKSYTIIFIGGFGGLLIGEFLSWRRYTEERHKIAQHLKKQSEQDAHAKRD